MTLKELKVNNKTPMKQVKNPPKMQATGEGAFHIMGSSLSARGFGLVGFLAYHLSALDNGASSGFAWVSEFLGPRFLVKNLRS